MSMKQKLYINPEYESFPFQRQATYSLLLLLDPVRNRPHKEVKKDVTVVDYQICSVAGISLYLYTLEFKKKYN